MDTNGRVGFRDIYRAVGESEARIIERIDMVAAGPIADHESRLRAIENGIAPSIAADHAALAALAVRMTAVETAASFFKDREIGVFSTLGGIKTTIIMVAAMLGPILAVVALVAK